MTAPGNDIKPEEKAAAAVAFGTIMAAALGGVGLVLAAMAVGTERVWSGWRGERQAEAADRQARREARLAWGRQALAESAEAQRAYRRAMSDWRRSGAKADARPARPSAAHRAGVAVRNGAARGIVAAAAARKVGGRAWRATSDRWHDFTSGARDGWQAANEVRRNGGSFAAVARARPRPAGSPGEGSGSPGEGSTEGRESVPAERPAPGRRPQADDSSADGRGVPSGTDGGVAPTPGASVTSVDTTTAGSTNGNGSPHPRVTGTGAEMADSAADHTDRDLIAVANQIGKIEQLKTLIAREVQASTKLTKGVRDRVANKRGGPDLLAAADALALVNVKATADLAAVFAAIEQARERTEMARRANNKILEAQDRLRTTGAGAEFVQEGGAD